MAEENEVFVGIHLGGSTRPVPAGVLTFDDSADKAWFLYNPTYAGLIKDGRAFPLDPLNLPARAGEVELPSAAHPGVFGDGAPDDWGQTVLRRLLGVRSLTAVERLVHSGDDRIGALVFRHRTLKPAVRKPVEIKLLDRYSRFIRSFQEGAAPLTDDDMLAVALAGSSAGGAWPKCTFRDPETGTCWLAKFSRPGDPVSLPTIEHAAMRLAERCGIDSAATRLTASRVLLVERFDRTPDGGRRMFASLQSLLGSSRMCAHGYPEMAEVIRRVSGKPDLDARQLFRRMVFNAACGNTDDHLKNHAMLHDGSRWRLSPAYDVTPQVMGDVLHSIALGRDGAISTIENLLSECGAFTIDRTEARSIVAEVRAVCAGWRKFFQECGVEPSDIAMLEDGECFAKLGNAVAVPNP